MDNKIKEIIEDKIKNDDLHLFMKGTPLFPQCGFFKYCGSNIDIP